MKILHFLHVDNVGEQHVHKAFIRNVGYFAKNVIQQ